MTKLRDTVSIQAPVEKVFEFIDEPARVPLVGIDVSQVKDVSRGEKGVGVCMTLTYSALGTHFDEKLASNTTNLERLSQN